MRTISDAIKIGDKKMRLNTNSAIINAIKSVLKAHNFALTVSEINDELKKRYDAKQYDEFFITNDKTLINDDKSVKKFALLKIRCNDLVYNTRNAKNKIGETQIKRGYDDKLKAHDYYAVTTKALIVDKNDVKK